MGSALSVEPVAAGRVPRLAAPAVVAARGGEQGKRDEEGDQQSARTASHEGNLHKVDRISRVFLTGVRSARKSQDPLGFGPVLLARLLARVRRRGHDGAR